MASDGFRHHLDRAAKHLGSQLALAKALGIDPTRISRLMRGGGDQAPLVHGVLDLLHEESRRTIVLPG